ncbi:unnamed protein product [Mytilus edulis]|uniref:Uncharacterized protein n=1 Tax=Mytilus edulis TaxID=6550 RepID=A0A8S3QRT6_MYTED|nr:unnamed protein product [Mytilus edulis]
MHLLKYTKDTEQDKDWVDLVTISNIETAAKNVKRIAITLHLSFTTAFFKTLSEDEKHRYTNDMQHKDEKLLRHKWDTAFTEFIDKGLKQNVTFAIHFDMMQHCDEIVSISITERLGGPNGYNLMLACVKTSLPFAFLNGATSYASFCVDLLYCHYTAGVFHKKKESLFSTPYKHSSVNIALDTQKEMDHLNVKKDPDEEQQYTQYCLECQLWTNRMRCKILGG